MTLLHEYYIPGLHIEEHSIPVPLDWSGKVPGDYSRASGDLLSLFYRVLSAPEHAHDVKLPLLVYLQGGPGGAGPRPINPSDDGWIAEAIRHFRVILPDQRGTGRSSHVNAQVMEHFGRPEDQAAYLKHFLADSIVRDFEHLRRTEFDAAHWVTLGQSYGGFLTLTYLSLFPQGLAASFTCGGIPHVPADAREVYEHTFPRMAAKTRQYYDRYPQDRERVAAVAERLEYASGDDVTLLTQPMLPVLPMLPNGDPLSVERLQTLGGSFGMKPSFERVHWIFDGAFLDSDGEPSNESAPSSEFLTAVESATASNPLYWPLQEFIYADGELEQPIGWAAQQVRDEHPEFGTEQRPLLFTGEAMFPWMFEQERALRPFRAAMDVLMADTHFGTIYDAAQLARNEVPLQSAVYFDDMYVDSGLQLDTLSRIGRSHYWVTNEFEHDGLHGDTVFRRLYGEALDRGDLAGVFL
jgi:pimeloyl-ACP methyl ester carboxylesterase